MVLLKSFIPFFLSGMLSASSLVNGNYVIYWFSDTKCSMDKLIGGITGGEDVASTAAAGLECNQVKPKAKSFIALMGRCQLALHHFGGLRNMGPPECFGNGYTCQASTVVARGFGNHQCGSFDDRGITGWQMTVRKSDGNCPPGFGNKRRDDEPSRKGVPYGSVARSVGSSSTLEEKGGFFNVTEIMDAITRRGGPVNEIEENLFKRQSIKC